MTAGSGDDAVEEYVDRAIARVLEVLGEHHAVVHAELESRIAESHFRGSPENIDPHHVTTAIRELGKQDKITWTRAVTRGGRAIETISLADPGRTLTAIDRAARRRRLLLGRYHGWSQGTQRHPHGLIGPAGEHAVRVALTLSGALQPANPDFAECTHLLGTRLPGPADSGGYMVPVIRGMPQHPVTVVIEVKNLRSWIYPSAAELFQPLRKAAQLQREHPDAYIVPMLVCRRAHPTIYYMAQQLGFLVIEMDQQFAGAVSHADLDEIRNELAFSDIRVGHGPSLRVRDRLQKPNLIAAMPRVAQEWRNTALDDHAHALIQAARASSDRPRLRAVASLRSWNQLRGSRGGW